MSNSPRDTQFVGFAKLLYGDLKAQWLEDWKFTEDMQQIIARRAYDLVCHAISSQAQGMDLFSKHDPEYIQERVELVPDMTEWPNDQTQRPTTE